MKNQIQPIGVFDSGYGGLTILKEFVKQLPENDFIYLGDNARTPYGTRSFETVYQYTLEAVKTLFEKNCHLIILACNTASAKALRTIQQNDLPEIAPARRVLGVIRPSVEALNSYTKTRHVGVLGTNGTVSSDSYPIEIHKLFSDISTYQEACPMWVPLVENFEYLSDGADFFIKKNIDNLLAKNDLIDTIILGCTHYPILIEKIKKYTPEHIQLLSQGEIVTQSLINYLKRHPEMDKYCSRNQSVQFFTTENKELFEKQASLFFGEQISAEKIVLDSNH